MLRLTDPNGRRVYVAASNVRRITEAGASSQWHGIRCLLTTSDGQTIECNESADEVARMIVAEAAAASRVDESKDRADALNFLLSLLRRCDLPPDADHDEARSFWYVDGQEIGPGDSALDAVRRRAGVAGVLAAQQAGPGEG